MNPYIAGRIIYPLQERLLKRPTFRYLADLERSQWLSREEIERLQAARLKNLLQVAQDHCPWHAKRIHKADLDLHSEAPFTLEDLQRLPTMTRKDALENGERMVWRDVPGGAYRYNTGGSSGEPLIFYFGRWRQAADAASRMRARQWWGIEVGEREVYLWGAPVELNKTDYIKTIRDRLFNQLLLNAFEMSAEKMDEYVEAICGYRPSSIYGYASSLALLAAHIQGRRLRFKLPSLRVICTTGEPLYSHQRALIEETFAVPAANEFGSRDIGLIAHETPQRQLLLMSESVILEVLDRQGRPVTPGEAGEAVMTGLCSQAQPFIRYRTGDIVRYSDEVCRDRRGLHVIGEVLGRTTDFVTRSDGTIMHALAVIYVLRAVEGVAEFKFIQHAVDRVELLLVPSSKWHADKERIIIQGIQKRLGKEVRVEICLVDEISAEASGKHRYVVSHVPLPGALQLASHAGE